MPAFSDIFHWNLLAGQYLSQPCLPTMVIILDGRKLKHSLGSWLSFLKQVSMA